MDIRKAEIKDIDSIISLIQMRIDWMDEVGLCQWNKTDYLGVYTREYFEKGINEGSFFIAEENGEAVGTMALYRHDPRWEDGLDSVYVHHLTAKPGKKGVGRELIAFAEQYAKDIPVPMIRLDSDVDNKKLADYYEPMGYAPVGYCVDGVYKGILREKRF
ncbi:MAG: GNAT family N-acetyltransferase [Clostridia bacterium]|nr:GNAT family N-acetyltransferase [Clostridia bacterium]